MALNGTLEELAVLDVIQFANQAHLTGCLMLRRNTEEAELFYRKGGLVHARQGALTGIEVLVEVVDWSKGEFEFRTAIESPEETIRMDLHRAVMHALKKRDERKAASRGDAEQARSSPPAPTLEEQFRQLIAPHDFIQHAALFNADGVAAAAHRSPAPAEDLEPLCRSLWNFIGAHPRGELKKAILDDPKGTIVVSQAMPGKWLLVIPARGVTLGAITVGMGRFIGTLGSNLALNSNGAPGKALQ